MEDYRMNYVAKDAVGETYSLEIKGDKFVFHGNNGTVLEMKPILPKKIEVNRGDSIMIITKNKMIVKNVKIKPAKQEELELPNG